MSLYYCPQCKNLVWPWQKKFWGGPIPGSHKKCGIEATIQHTFLFWNKIYSIDKIKETWIYIEPKDKEIINGLRT